MTEIDPHPGVDPRLDPRTIAALATAALSEALAEFDGDQRALLTEDDLPEVAARVLGAVERACEARGVQHAVDVLAGEVADYQRHIIAPYTAKAATDRDAAGQLAHHREFFDGLNVAATAVRRLLAARMPLDPPPAAAPDTDEDDR